MSYSSYRVSFGTSQTCLRVQGQLETWKFRGLEAWFSRWGSAPHPYNSSVARLPGALFSVAGSPFSGAALAAPPPSNQPGAQKTLAPGRDMLLFYCHALGEPMQRFVQTHKGHRTKRRNFRPTVQARARAIACPCRCHWAGILRPRTRHRRRARLFAPCPPSQPPGDR